MILKNGIIYLENEILENGWIELGDGRVKNYGCYEILDSFVDLEGKYVLPGFIDQHIHGANGFDVMDGTIESLEKIALALPMEGVTSFLATTVTNSDEKICEALENVRDYLEKKDNQGAEVMGIHLEGPFISRLYPGAHLKEYIQKPEVEIYKKYEALSGGNIKIVTLAPEEDDDYRLIKYLESKHIISSVGHSNASYKEIKEAVRFGLTGVTHCYNATNSLHHRELGIVGAAMLMEELKAEIICDGIHVDPNAVNLLYKNKGSKGLILISDAMRAKGLKNGEYELAGQRVQLIGNQVRTSRGNLAGSILKINDAAKNMMAYSNCCLKEITKMTSENPAKQIGVYDRKGSIAKGKDGDLVILDKDLSVYMTICKGKIVYRREDNDKNNRSKQL